MLHSASLLLVSLLAALPVNADGLYTKNSPVIQLNAKTYNSLIANSNHTSIVEFYAPWCGHCKNLKPAFEKAAKNLDGLAKVAAINCDDDENKPFCGQMGVQGFPTLKIVTPSKKPGKPRVEDYQGARSAKGIVDAVVDRIPNHVKRATDKDLDKWLGQNEDRPKAILFTEKGTTGALIRALAIDFLGAIDIAQVRNKETASVKKFGVTELPALVLISGADAEPKIYSGELKKKPITEFLSQAATPNPDVSPRSASSKPKSKPKSKPASKPTTVVDDTEDLKPTASQDQDETDPSAKPVQVPIPAPPIPTLSTPESLESACLAPKSGTCVLAILPEASEPDAALPVSATEALASLAEIGHKHAQRGTHLFPLFAVPAINTASKTLREALSLADDQMVEIIALNARRGWWRRFSGADADFGAVAVESWVDGIRLGEGAKEKLPEGIVAGVEAEAEPEAEPEAEVKPEAETETEIKAEAEEHAVEHDEL
ncbi:Thioredoxin [Penicillium italicum]|uniref:protein disulfide-isomerase n=1 Tax=Penicillium italicum TaxID=40296 RepID=A0A0A2KH16_PENIT|nr:Thioredoxin [Penicillium italicum]